MGPRRTTISYSSEDAPSHEDHKIFVYYCKHSGRHALTTDCDLSAAPRRRADHALIVDTQRHTVRLYTTDGGVKYLRRAASGAVERQHRLAVGELPVAYRTEPGGRYLYVLDGALTAVSAAEGAAAAAAGDGGGALPPTPPCIAPAPGGGARVALELEDRGARPVVLRVAAGAVRVQIRAGLGQKGAAEELLDFMRGVLGVRLGQLALERGESARLKTLVVEGLGPDAVFAALLKNLEAGEARGGLSHLRKDRF